MPTTSKKKSTKSAAKKTPQAGDAVMVAPEYYAQTPTYYSNFAAVSHTTTEVSIDFCLLAPPYNVKSDEQLTALAPVVAKVVIPPAMVSRLVNALQQQEIKQKKTAESGQTLIPITAIPK